MTMHEVQQDAVTSSLANRNDERERLERAVEYVRARWGVEILRRYKWENLPRKLAGHLRICAQMAPDFIKMFVPWANSILIERYEASLWRKDFIPVGCHGSRARRNAPTSPLLDNEIKQLASILQRNQGLHSPDRRTHDRVGQWTTISEQEFKAQNPWALKCYLLKYDGYGMLIPRDLTLTISSKREKRPIRELDATNVYGNFEAIEHRTDTLPTNPNVDEASLHGSVTTPLCHFSPFPSSGWSECEILQPESPAGPLERELWQMSEVQAPSIYYTTSTPAEYLNYRSLSGPYALPADPPWPDVYAPSLPMEQYVGNRVPEKESDALFLTHEEFRVLAEARTPIRKPVVIRNEPFDDSREYSSLSFAEALRLHYGDSNADVREALAQTTEEVDVGRFASTIGESGADKSYNMVFCRSITNAVRPSFTRMPRFQLLQGVVRRIETEVRLGGQSFTNSMLYDLEGCLAFNTFSFENTSSIAYVNPFIGQWVRNLSGIQMWMIVPENQMMKSDWDELARDGADWEPRGKARLVILRKGDVLILPPGTRIVRTIHTAQACLTESGMFWDQVQLTQLLHSLDWVCNEYLPTNAPIIHQLRQIIPTLFRWVVSEPERFFDVESKDFRESYRDAMAGFHKLSF